MEHRMYCVNKNGVKYEIDVHYTEREGGLWFKLVTCEEFSDGRRRGYAWEGMALGDEGVKEWKEMYG